MCEPSSQAPQQRGEEQPRQTGVGARADRGRDVAPGGAGECHRGLHRRGHQAEEQHPGLHLPDRRRRSQQTAHQRTRAVVVAGRRAAAVLEVGRPVDLQPRVGVGVVHDRDQSTARRRRCGTDGEQGARPGQPQRTGPQRAAARRRPSARPAPPPSPGAPRTGRACCGWRRPPPQLRQLRQLRQRPVGVAGDRWAVGRAGKGGQALATGGVARRSRRVRSIRRVALVATGGSSSRASRRGPERRAGALTW